MVRATRANTNTEIHAPLPSHPQAQRSRFNAPFPAAGGGTGCALALGPAEGTRAARRAGGAARAPPAGIPRRRVSDLPRQGPRAKISGEDK